jgi:hypothetical protein
MGHPFGFNARYEYSPTAWNFPKKTQALSFGTMLSPDHLRRKISWRVSCYAIFKWWLLLSQHPRCKRSLTSLSALSINFGTLTSDLDCFPFDRRTLAPVVLLPSYNSRYSEFGRRDEISPYSNLPVLYPLEEHLTLYLNIFRREPAISKFD